MPESLSKLLYLVQTSALHNAQPLPPLEVWVCPSMFNWPVGSAQKDTRRWAGAACIYCLKYLVVTQQRKPTISFQFKIFNLINPYRSNSLHSSSKQEFLPLHCPSLPPSSLRVSHFPSYLKPPALEAAYFHPTFPSLAFPAHSLVVNSCLLNWAVLKFLSAVTSKLL